MFRVQSHVRDHNVDMAGLGPVNSVLALLNEVRNEFASVRSAELAVHESCSKQTNGANSATRSSAVPTYLALGSVFRYWIDRYAHEAVSSSKFDDYATYPRTMSCCERV